MSDIQMAHRATHRTTDRTTKLTRGILIILSSPSGAGKTTLARRLISEFDDIVFSVSYTTRPPRKTERNGVDYHFVDTDKFRLMAADNEFAEWAEVHGHFYGTSRAVVEDTLLGGRDIIFDIDWQGARTLAQTWPDDALTIFILPPDLDTLAARLRGRASDTEDVIRKRLDNAIDEIRHCREYQHIIVNAGLDEAYQTLRAIYLVRRYGPRDREDTNYHLSALAQLVQRNQRLRGDKHAEDLIAQSEVRLGH